MFTKTSNELLDIINVLIIKEQQEKKNPKKPKKKQQDIINDTLRHQDIKTLRP